MALSDRYHLYFIAILPDDSIQSKITGIKQHFSTYYSSCHALRSPPHITLHMPFRWRKDRESILDEHINAYSRLCHSFKVQLNGFGAFTPRVIYIQVEDSGELNNLRINLLDVTRKKLKIGNDSNKDRGFHPHITVAFRDLTKKQFALAWEEFKPKSFSAEFESNSLTLLKHNGKIWEVHRSFPYS